MRSASSRALHDFVLPLLRYNRGNRLDFAPFLICPLKVVIKKKDEASLFFFLHSTVGEIKIDDDISITLI